MPEGELPLSLQFAAAANVLLGALKLDDQIKDAPGLKWKLARHFFSNSFREAHSRFREWGLDTRFLWHWVEQQDEREKSEKTSFASLGTLMEYYAEPTAQMTGWIFKHGATVAGQAGQAEAMYNLGYQFGRLAYALDAFEDLEKDLSSHQFNPLARFFNAKVTLSSFQFEQARQLVLQYRQGVEYQLAELPLSAENVSHYALRLHAGVGLRLYKERQAPLKFQLARKAANNLAERMVLHPASILRTANHYLVSFIVLALPLAADMVSYNHREVTYKWLTVFTAVLGGMGLLLYAKKQRTKRRLKAIKRKLGVRLFFRRIKKLFSKEPDCCEDCFSACCTACIGACAEFCCQAICNALCGKITNTEKGAKVLKWIVIVAAILILALMIAF